MRSRLSSLLMTIPAALLLTPSLWRGRGHTQHTLQLSLSNSFRLITTYNTTNSQQCTSLNVTTSIVLPLLLLYPSPSRSGYPAVLIPTLTLLLRALLTCGTSRSISRVNDLFTDPLRDHLIQLTKRVSSKAHMTIILLPLSWSASGPRAYSISSTP